MVFFWLREKGKETNDDVSVCDIFLVLVLSNTCLTTLIKSQENWSDVKYNMMAVKFLKHESFVVIPPKFDEYISYC